MSLPVEETLSEGKATRSWLRAVPLANKLEVMSRQVPVHFQIHHGQYTQHNDATDLEDVNKSIP